MALLVRDSLLTAWVAACLLVGCGRTQAAEQMAKLADRLCACADATCATAAFAEVEAYARANAGKDVSAATAERYDKDLRRAQACHAAQVPPAAPGSGADATP